MNLIRGVLLAGGFRTHHELIAMSADDQRNTLIVEMANHSNQTNYQSFSNDDLAGVGALMVFLLKTGIRTSAQLKTISADDQRNIMIVEIDGLTHQGKTLQGLSNIDLVLLGLGQNLPGPFIRGVLLAGGIRTHHELIAMSADDQRNTLIVEMANHSNLPAGHFQSLNDFDLAGVGVAMVFLLKSGIRDVTQLKMIGDDDQRNIAIVEVDGQTHLGVRLQGLRTIDVVGTALGVDPTFFTPTISRMNSNFNAQPLGAPQQFPAPSPPNDQFIWLSQQPLSSVVVSNPSGGNWVLTVPKPDFVSDPDTLRQFLLASSESFTTNPPAQMRGQFSIRLLGPGKVSFGIRATRDSAAGFVGAGELSTSPFGGGGVGMVLDPAVIDNLAAFSFRDFPVTFLAIYNPGQVEQFFYSVDQPSRTFNLSVGGGSSPSGSQSTNYGFSGPIQKLELWLFLRQPTSDTKVFVNDVKVDEIK